MSQSNGKIRSLEELGAKKALGNEHWKISKLVTDPHSSFFCCNGRGRSFYSFLKKLRDLILPGFLHHKCIKRAQGLLFSVASILHACHIAFISACSVFIYFYYFYWFFFFWRESVCWRVQPVLINSSVKSPFVFLVNFKDVDWIVLNQWCYQDCFYSNASSSPLLISSTESLVISIQFGLNRLNHWLLLSLA